MKKDFKISDIYTTLDNIVKNNPQTERISLLQLEKALRISRTPVIYNLELILKDLEKKISERKRKNYSSMIRL